MARHQAIDVRPGIPGDRDAAEALLAVAELPLAGFRDHPFLVAERDGALVGCVALEIYGKHGLLRSLVVDPSARAQGLGVRLVEEAIALARRSAVEQLWLLTTTAGAFFPRF